MRAVFAAAAVVAAVPAVASLVEGCSDPATALTTVLYTDIYVDPASFQGSVVCSQLPGALRSYVVTLYDLTQSGPDASSTAGGFPLASTPPTDCALQAAVGAVVPGDFYVGQVDGYDLPACSPQLEVDGAPRENCIVPLGAPPLGPYTLAALATGARTMVDTTGAIVAPRWTSSCGDPRNYFLDAGLTPPPVDASPDAPFAYDGGPPTLAYSQAEVYLAGCSTFGGPAATTSSVVVRTQPLLNGAACGQGAGQIDHFTVAPIGGAASQAKVVSCGADATFAGVTPQAALGYQVLGFSAGVVTAGWGTSCSAIAPAGVTIPASCDPLTTTGALRVAGTAACAKGVASFQVDVLGAPASGETVGCPGDALIRNLAPGPYTVRVLGFAATGAPDAGDGGPAVAERALCQATVLPGQIADATCQTPLAGEPRRRRVLRAAARVCYYPC